MAYAFKCDVCGKYYDDTIEYGNMPPKLTQKINSMLGDDFDPDYDTILPNIKIYIGSSAEKGAEGIKFDLCSDCINRVIDLLLFSQNTETDEWLPLVNTDHPLYPPTDFLLRVMTKDNLQKVAIYYGNGVWKTPNGTELEDVIAWKFCDR